jgi:phosphatidylserine/phosphatidylglycerophosphate/cardiolipin synthase-like enzyme
MKLTREAVYLTLIILLISVCGQFYYSYKYLPAHQVQVFYNRDIEANEKVKDVIYNAEKFVYFAIYTFTKSDIKDALIGAKHRGLEVRGVVDREQTENIEQQKEIVAELQAAGIEVSEHTHSALMHIKTIVSDKSYASGSYNWTANATTSNDEVLEVGTDEGIRRQYERVVLEVLGKYKRE